MTASVGPFQLATTYLRLRPDVSIEPLAVDATFWQRISSGQLVREVAYVGDAPKWRRSGVPDFGGGRLYPGRRCREPNCALAQFRAIRNRSERKMAHGVSNR
jgi:hypothetical protein